MLLTFRICTIRFLPTASWLWFQIFKVAFPPERREMKELWESEGKRERKTEWNRKRERKRQGDDRERDRQAVGERERGRGRNTREYHNFRAALESKRHVVIIVLSYLVQYGENKVNRVFGQHAKRCIEQGWNFMLFPERPWDHFLNESLQSRLFLLCR